MMNPIRTLLLCVSFGVVLGTSSAAAVGGLRLNLEHVPPLPATETDYQPPEWFQCEVEVPENPSFPPVESKCLDWNTTDNDAGSIPFHEGTLKMLQSVNERANAYFATFDVPEMIRAAMVKKEALVMLGLSGNAFRLAVGETPAFDTEGSIPYVVLIVYIGKFQVVMDGHANDLMPWTCSPGRFYGIQDSQGNWVSVADDRDDPLESSNECFQ
jgi:hypothetical protein